MNDRIKTAFLVIALWLSALATTASPSADGELYAVLISGGRNRLSNHERYWNDCTFLYRTLRMTYHVPKRNIMVLMSDGGDPEPDMLLTDGRGFASSPTDLDGDGLADVYMPATEEAVDYLFIQLSRQLTEADRLFVFLIDHGMGGQSPCVWLWDNGQLSAYALWSLLGLLRAEAVGVLMGQCYAGAFLPRLMGDGRVLMAACAGDELSWVCPDRPYDEFVHHWTCAVNGADADGNVVQADEDGDGQVTMAEAFDYARRHDRRQETPQYASWPEQLGATWAFGPLDNVGVASVHEEQPQRQPAYSLQGYRQPRRGGVRVEHGKKFIDKPKQ